MTECSPARDRVTVLRGTEVEFSVALPGSGPYNVRVVENGRPELPETLPPSREAWTEPREFDEAGEYERRMIALGPGDVSMVEMTHVDPEELDEEDGAYGIWAVDVIDPDALSEVERETAATLVENTVGLFTGGSIPFEAVERLYDLAGAVDAGGGAAGGYRFGDLPEFEVLEHVVERNRE